MNIEVVIYYMNSNKLALQFNQAKTSSGFYRIFYRLFLPVYRFQNTTTKSRNR